MNQPGGDLNQPGGDLERRPAGRPVPYVQGQRGEGWGHRQGAQCPPGASTGRGEFSDVVDWPELAAWARARVVLLGALALIAAQLVWKSLFLGHYYYFQDDFHFLEVALSHSFSWNYLILTESGHLLPGVNAIAWAVARLSLYGWPLASAVTVIMLAVADLAAFRLLRTLFGDRPGILVLLAVYLLSPLALPDIRWWSAAIESLPLQIATFTALNAQVHYAATGRLRHAVAAAAWVLFGLVFFEKALILPFLLLGVTSAVFLEGPWLRSIGRCLAGYWLGWVLQLAVLGGYLTLFAVSLHASPKIPGSAAGIFTFISELVKNTFVPGAIGGPWQWLPASGGEYAYSSPPAALAWLSLIVAAGVIGASIWSRRYAWRAWAILAGWLAAADVVPVLIGRISELGPRVIGLETRYVADALPVLVICLGLAFWPVAGRPDAADRRWAVSGPGQAARMVAAGLVGAFIIGSVWSAQALQNVTSTGPDRAFIANARAAVAQAPAGTVIADQPVPPALMLRIFGTYAYASRVVGPLENAAAAARIRWTARPDGTIDHLMVFAADGRLHPAAVLGQVSVPMVFGQSCQVISHGQAVVRLPARAGGRTEVLHVAYLASAKVNGDEAAVSYGRSSLRFPVRAGLHDAYFPVRGNADRVTVSGPAMAGLCVGGMQAGVVVPSTSGPVIPAK